MRLIVYAFPVLFLTAQLAQAQNYAELNINQVQARFYSHGLVGVDPATNIPHFEVPAGGDTHPLFSAGLWIGGMSVGNQLHLAAMNYETLTNADFFPGPLTNDGSASIDQATSTAYDHVWSALGSDIALQQAYCTCLSTPGCDVAVEFPGYQMPASFGDWPAMGDINASQDLYLAPFIDYNADGDYNSNDCDAPCIRGDQMLYTIFNDKLQFHQHSGCQPLGVQVQAMPFAYAGVNDALDHTVFVRYVITNQSTQTYLSTSIGLFTDFDLGGYNDDYIGSDPVRNLWYVYNADNSDGDEGGTNGYGTQPPAFGAVVFQGPRLDLNNLDAEDPSTLPAWNGSGFDDGYIDNERGGLDRVAYMLNSGTPAMSDPVSCPNFFNYLTGFWVDNTPQTYGGTGYDPNDPDAIDARFAFPGDTDPSGVGTGGVAQAPWSEVSAGNTAGDRRAMGVMTPFTFEPGMVQEIVIGFVYARASSGGPQASIAALQARVDSISPLFGDAVLNICTGIGAQAGINEGASQATIELFPTPTTDRVRLVAPAGAAGTLLSLFDATGRCVGSHRLVQGPNEIDVQDLASGVYSCEVRTSRTRFTGRLVKE